MAATENPRPEFTIETSVGIFFLNSYKSDSIHLRFGRRHAGQGMSEDHELPNFTVNGVDVRGNIDIVRGDAEGRRFANPSQWYYDGGTIERSVGWGDRATDSARQKIITAALEEVPGLITGEMRAVWARYFAVGTLNAARATVARLEEELEDAKAALVQAAVDATLAEADAEKFAKAGS